MTIHKVLVSHRPDGTCSAEVAHILEEDRLHLEHCDYESYAAFLTVMDSHGLRRIWVLPCPHIHEDTVEMWRPWC